ncbi:MAG: sulfatase-like hydrolase/transferase [Dokdonella sp.]
MLMLVDNFTYTAFGWGIVKTTALTKPIYWLLAVVAFVLHVRRTPTRISLRPAIAAALLLASGVGLLWSFHDSGQLLEGTVVRDPGAADLPNIVMFASDGVNAKSMSAYGYARATTPHLDPFMDQALVAENAFTNSGWSTGSLTSMMTGKYPATTKVLYPPYTLQGTDAYENLPRILHELGYRNLQETVRYYADGPDLNWKDSFDSANGREVERASGSRTALALQNPLLLGDNLYERLASRVQQLLFIKPMVDTYAEVTSTDAAKVYGTSDQTRMDRVADFITQSRQPFFIHIHLMGTHCCSFHPKERHFSARKFDKKSELEKAEYDDSILESDQYFGQLIDMLKQSNQLKNTLIIYTSDHNKGWDFRSPVPLIFLFPNGAHQGHLTRTTQLLDVAPTVLDYLKVKIPSWMEGRSLLRDDLDHDRPVFSIFRMERSHFKTKEKDVLARVADLGPPTYGVDLVGMVVCQRWYMMRLEDEKITSGAVVGYQDKCPTNDLPTNDQAKAMMGQYLRKRGFNF